MFRPSCKKNLTFEEEQASAGDIYVYTNMHTACRGIQHISGAQTSHFLFVFSPIIGSFKCHYCIKIRIIIFQHPHTRTHTHTKGLICSHFFCDGFGPNRAAEEVVFCCGGLPGREDEKQSTWCRLGTAWTTVRDWKWHIHRSMYECGSQLAPRDFFFFFFLITFYLCPCPFAAMFYIFYHMLLHSIWINLLSIVARHTIIIRFVWSCCLLYDIIV